jgi:hypothetical protein
MNASSLRFTLATMFALAMTAPGCLMPKPVGSDGSDGAVADSAAPDGGFTCVGPDGTGRRAGERFPSADGCNTCTCGVGGAVACTERACAPTDGGGAPDASGPIDAGPAPDAGARTCRGTGDCGAGQMCAGPQGCGVVWTCVIATPCTADLAPFCGCDGRTIQGSSSCPPAPYVHRGPCETTPDAGTNPPSDAGGCRRTGCSLQLCADMDMASTCEFRPEYACYASATCERQAGGACGWTATPALTACIASARGDGG